MRRGIRKNLRNLFKALILLCLAIAMTLGSGTTTALADDAGDSLLAKETDSAVTLSEAKDGAGADSNMPDLKVTVNQTKDLQNQAVQVSWTGALNKATEGNVNNGYSPYMQVFQCWADDGETAPNPEHCEFGQMDNYTMRSQLYLPSSLTDKETCLAYAKQESLAFDDNDCSHLKPGDDSSSIEWAFKPAPESPLKGDLTGSQANGDNKYWTFASNNYLGMVPNSVEGTGQASFETQTGLESNGLGCGYAREDNKQPRDCWIVVVPRAVSTKVPDAKRFVTSSPFLSENWKNALYVKQSFRSLGASCPTSAGGDVTVQGTDMMSNAFSSWQPALCQQQGGRTYSLLTGNDQQSVSAAASGETMALTTGSGDAVSSLSYAPVAVTAPTVSFVFTALHDSSQAQTLRLSPRLLAKLLTYSYWSPLSGEKGGYRFDEPALMEAPFMNQAVLDNPLDLTSDPEFQALNPGWDTTYKLLDSGKGNISMPYGNSEYALQVWKYIWADADARAFLNGQADPWGMKVNPYYSSSQSYVDAFNKKYQGLSKTLETYGSATFVPASVVTYPLTSFPKSDPTNVNPFVKSNGMGAHLCDTQPADLVTAFPYESDSQSAAKDVLRGVSMLASWQQSDLDCSLSKYVTTRQAYGTYTVMALSDSSSSARFGVRSAALGQPSAKTTTKSNVATARVYVSPSTASMAAATSSMAVTDASTGVVGLDYEKGIDSQAYPLTMPVYAAASASTAVDTSTRKAWAQLIRYGVSDEGQKSGMSVGNLPYGYAPIPLDWRIAALNAADKIEKGVAATSSGNETTTSNESTPDTNDGDTGDTTSSPDTNGANDATTPTASTGDNPSSTGSQSGSLAGAATPSDGTQVAKVAVPVGIFGSLAAGCAVPVLRRKFRLHR